MSTDILITLAGRFDENRPIVASSPGTIQVSSTIVQQVASGHDHSTDAILHPSDTPGQLLRFTAAGILSISHGGSHLYRILLPSRMASLPSAALTNQKKLVNRV